MSAILTKSAFIVSSAWLNRRIRSGPSETLQTKRNSLDIGVQGSDIIPIPHIDLFRHFLPSLDDLEKGDQTPPLIVCQSQSVSV